MAGVASQHDIKAIASVTSAPPEWYFSTEPDTAYTLLQQLLQHKKTIIREVKRLGTPIASGPQKNKLVVMCVNTGYLSLFLNWLCGCRKNGIDVSNLMVFASSPRLGKVLRRYGINVVAQKGIGRYDEGKPDYYGDGTFVNLMWLKTVSVFLALEAGFDVLFQDVDVVWLRNPWPEITRLAGENSKDPKKQYDHLWMDDGARSKRFAPLYANSGFFYFRSTTQSIMYWRRILYSYSELRAFFKVLFCLTIVYRSNSVHDESAGSNRFYAWCVWQDASSRVRVYSYVTGHHLRLGLKAAIFPPMQFTSGHIIGSPHHMEKYTAGTWKPLVMHVCWTVS